MIPFHNSRFLYVISLLKTGLQKNKHHAKTKQRLCYDGTLPAYIFIGLFVAVAFFLGGCSCRSGHTGKSVTPSFEVAVNPKLKPSSQPLPVFEDGVSRPLATLTDKSGKQTDFVEDELIIELATENELTAFLKKWHGKILATNKPKTVGINANPAYLIRVQTSGANVSKLATNLKALNKDSASSIAVSSEAAKRLIAIGAETAVAGKVVGINYLSSSDNFQDGQLAEALMSGNTMNNDAGTLIENWDPNPFNWIYMKSGGPFDIGVTAAWKVLERIGAFNNKVKIAVIDGGFGTGDDFPTPYEFNKASFAALDPTGPNEVSCSNNSVCRWHGWNVVNAAMGQVNNGIGAAGPAGPVGRLLAIRRSADIFNNIQAITLALFSGAKIINMSFSARIPAIVSWSVIPFNLATGRAHAAGKLLIASAGNDGEDIDEEDCFIKCWESAWWTPAENDGVIAVGSMDAGAPNRRGDSNYGDDELDIYGPGSVWVAGDFDNNAPHVFTATSAAAPNVAGIAALIWAANPQLSNNNVERILYETAHYGKDGQVSRWPNAYAGVVKALGGTPPEISIAVQPLQEFGKCKLQYQLMAKVTDPDDGPANVTWTSDIAGVLGTGELLTRSLPDGTHHITATAMDGIGLATTSNEVVQVVSNNVKALTPKVEIISLTNHQTFAANQSITFEAGGLDPNNVPRGLIAANVRWVSSRDGELGSGQRIFRKLSPGAHYIYVYYTGACGGIGDDFRLIQVTAGVVDAPPNMVITTPSNNDLVVYADNSGQACLHVAGFGYDEEDKDFATIEWWETDRSDLQWKVLSFNQNTDVCLKLANNAVSTTHKIRLRGKDKKGHIAYSSSLVVTVLPKLR